MVDEANSSLRMVQLHNQLLNCLACATINLEDSCDNVKTGIAEENLNVDRLMIACDFDSYAILLGYPRYAGHN